MEVLILQAFTRNAYFGLPPPWAQGVGRSNRPAPTKSPADSKRVVRSEFHRLRHSFASTVPKLCQNPAQLGPVLCQNSDRFRWPGGSVWPTPHASSVVSSASIS